MCFRHSGASTSTTACVCITLGQIRCFKKGLKLHYFSYSDLYHKIMQPMLLKLDFFIDLAFFYSFHQCDRFLVYFILLFNPCLEGTRYLRVSLDISGGDVQAQSRILPLLMVPNTVCREESCTQHFGTSQGQILPPKFSALGNAGGR